MTNPLPLLDGMLTDCGPDVPRVGPIPVLGGGRQTPFDGEMIGRYIRRQVLQEARDRLALERYTAVILAALPDLTNLRRSPYRDAQSPLRGTCYYATEALWHMLGRSEVWRPHVLRWPPRTFYAGETHWYLDGIAGRHDLTARQYKGLKIPYYVGRGCGFLTREPSNRARVLIDVCRQADAC